jgi:CBS domain-containing protein
VIARGPVLRAAPTQLAVDATIDMLAAGTEHLVVMDDRELFGVVSAADLMGLDTHSPFALRHRMLAAGDEDAVVAAAQAIPRVFGLLLDSGLTPANIGRVLALQHDTLTARLIELSIARHRPPPVPWAWLMLGSGARREFTLASDQDNALAYAASEPDADPYFARLATEVNAGLERCGFRPDANEVLARNRMWRMSDDAWRRTFDECLALPDDSHLLRATVSFDFRPISGGLPIVAQLAERLHRAREYPDFMRRLARTATDFHAPLGFRGMIAVKRGESAGTVDLKRGGVIPIVNLARFHAMAGGITVSGTIDRLTAARETGGLDDYTARSLTEAFNVICAVRLEHHRACITEGRALDNLIDPHRMAPIARGELREAFRAIARAQKRLGVFVPTGV